MKCPISAQLQVIKTSNDSAQDLKMQHVCIPKTLGPLPIERKTLKKKALELPKLLRCETARPFSQLLCSPSCGLEAKRTPDQLSPGAFEETSPV